MANWQPLAYLLISVFVLATLTITILDGFIDVSTPSSNSSIISPLVTYISGSFVYSINASLFGFDFTLPLPNFLAILPQEAQDYIVSDFIALSYIPDWFLIPFSILFILALVWTLIALIKPMSS